MASDLKVSLFRSSRFTVLGSFKAFRDVGIWCLFKAFGDAGVGSRP